MKKYLILLNFFRILYSTFYETRAIVGYFGSNSLFNVLLCTLQVMHIIWFAMIVKVAIKSSRSGKVEKDDRSESDAESFYQDEIKKQKVIGPKKEQ